MIARLSGTLVSKQPPTLVIDVNGVGYDVDTVLLDALATEFTGSSHYVTPDQRIDTEVARLWEQVSTPVLSDIEISIDAKPMKGDWNGAGWDGTCMWMDAPYSVELSVGGKYVYGYNWRMRNVDMEQACGPGWLKTGYWRLTFYTPGAVAFDDPLASVTAPRASRCRIDARSACISTSPASRPHRVPAARSSAHCRRGR